MDKKTSLADRLIGAAKTPVRAIESHMPFFGWSPSNEDEVDGVKISNITFRRDPATRMLMGIIDSKEKK